MKANLWTSEYFPAAVSGIEAEEGDSSTEPSELASQLPDAPTTEPTDVEDTQEPLSKKQKTTEAADDEEFVVVEKQDAQAEGKPKPEL
jgi:hypothetical protein